MNLRDKETVSPTETYGVSELCRSGTSREILD